MLNPSSYVIAVSSISGGGKTTLVNAVARALNATSLFFDDYASVSSYPSDLKKWVENGADVNEWKTPRFSQDLATLRRGTSITSITDGAEVLPAPFIVIEEPMGRERSEMAPLIDFAAVIDTPPEIALARRLLRDIGQIPLENLEEATKEELVRGSVQLITYLRDYLHGYLNATRDLYISVQEAAKVSCDIVLDGALSVDEMTQALVSAVKGRQRDRGHQ